MCDWAHKAYGVEKGKKVKKKNVSSSAVTVALEETKDYHIHTVQVLSLTEVFIIKSLLGAAAANLNEQ